MDDNYLWDRSGDPDPDVVRLERLLAPLRHTPPAVLREPAGRPASGARLLTGLAAAAVVLLMAGIAWQMHLTTALEDSRPGWNVDRLEGTPTISDRPVVTRDRLPEGGLLTTGDGDRARIEVAGIGHVDVDPESRVELLRAHGPQYRLRLARGRLHATIVAPPGQFVVETPTSTAIDLGCAYTLEVDANGTGSVRVTSGWVAFEWQGRESFIPAGAMCPTRRGAGPGIPYYEDAPAGFAAALATLDRDSAAQSERAAALARVLALAREQDAFTLWHILSRARPEERVQVFDRLAALVPPPDGIVRAVVVAGNLTSLDRWWDAFGLGTTGHWRVWKQRWAEERQSR